MYRHAAVLAVLIMGSLHAYEPLSHAQINASINRIHQIDVPIAYQRLVSSMRTHGNITYWRSVINTELNTAKNSSASFAGEVARARVTNLIRLQKLLRK